MSNFIPGQRWFSVAEPELGLGTVMRLVGRSVQFVFTGSGVVRQYSLTGAPLARAEFRAGDRLRKDGVDLDVLEAEEKDGLLRYRTAMGWLNEGELDAEQPVSQADSRLLAGRVDRNDQFEFRIDCLRQVATARANPGHGILGARIELIAHQLRAAEIAAERRQPRLLLADEVGLGKTIEACLIIAQQLASGRAERVLVLVPESLVHQWFVELKRRFNLAFAIYDEERCESLELNGSVENPFDDAQLVIASTAFLARLPKRATQAVESGWDLLVVDEAHHLEWTPEAASPEYALVERLAERTPGLVLLTATPEQLGRGGHFARLRLLDPARYADLESFSAESGHFVEVSQAVGRLLDGESLDPASRQRMLDLLGGEADNLAPLIERAENGDAAAREQLLDALIDRHGTGRVMLRNRRAAVGGFPARIKHLDLLPADPADPILPGRLLAEFLDDAGRSEAEPEHDYGSEPRFEWLLGKLDALAPAKVLILCASRGKVQALEDALRRRSGVACARFHEDMNLLQRDRNAAYFADPAGARVLLASEIGAEGRNFQFAQHLLLWDLPLDPDQLEQRIGRLDRIGQHGDVNLHACAVEGSPQHLLLRWYDEGLDAFAQVCPDGRQLALRFADQLVLIALDESPGDERSALADRLIGETRAAHAELSEAIAQGRDRLLEIASQRGSTQGDLLRALRQDDDDPQRTDFVLRLLEQLGVHNEPLGRGMYALDPEYMVTEGFEDFRDGPRQACFDRAHALTRDDLLYLRSDHPLVAGALELLLSGEQGNAAFLIDEAQPQRSVVLEAVFVLETVAQRSLHVERFLAPLPMVVAVDTRLSPRDGFTPSERARQRASERSVDLLKFRKVLGALLPPMLKAASGIANTRAVAFIENARARATTRLDAEIARLSELARINPAVRPQEIEALKGERESVLKALQGARPRLDALRLVASPDFLALRA